MKTEQAWVKLTAHDRSRLKMRRELAEQQVGHWAICLLRARAAIKARSDRASDVVESTTATLAERSHSASVRVEVDLEARRAFWFHLDTGEALGSRELNKEELQAVLFEQDRELAEVTAAVDGAPKKRGRAPREAAQ